MAKRSYHVNVSVYDELYDWKRERWDELTMCGSEKENVKWTLLTVTMPLKLPEDKEVLWWCCWRASERANRASCSWTGTPLYSPLHPLPPIFLPLSRVSTTLLRHFPLPLLRDPCIIRHSRILRYSDIACGVVPVAASLLTNQSPLPINPLYVSPYEWSALNISFNNLIDA